MDSLPRNDEWMPLASQQLRLRHLIRIIGLNIVCRDKCKLYFTLHHNLDCPAFYRSADIQHYGNSEAILWDNITCPEIFKSNSRAVCVRVWERRCKNQPQQKSSHQQPKQQEEREEEDDDDDDNVIFVWRIWFSGLVLTGSSMDAKYFSNTLIFQLNENCFSSPEHFSSFLLDNNDYLYDNIQDHDQNNIPKIHNTESRDLAVDGGVGSREITQNESSKLKNFDSSLDLCGLRCLSARRLKKSTRQSYSLDKLLRIQQIQRSCKRLKEDLHTITEQIINHNLRPKSFVSKNRSSIDYLFSDVNEIKPEDKLECKQLKIKIEQLRFKCNLLEKEHQTAIERNKELIRLLRNQKQQTRDHAEAMRENYTRMADDKSLVQKQMKVILSDVKTKKELEHQIRKRLRLLGCELKHIYPIKENPTGCFTVCNLPFPDKNYLSSNSLISDHSKLMTPAALSVTLGFVSHFIEITAIILDKPLRFPQQTKPSIPSKQILYGIYLLNYNIAQLNFDVFGFPYDPHREIIHNFSKLFRSLINLGEHDNEEEDNVVGVVDGRTREDKEIRLEDVSIAKSSNSNLSLINYLQVDRENMMQTRRRKTTSATEVGSEDKRYHSEDNLKTLAEHCLKHSYSHERLGKE